MFCNKCGKKIDDNSKFCNFCGHRTDGEVIEKPISMPTNEEPIEEIKTEPIFEEEIEEVIEEPLEEQAEEETIEMVQEEPIEEPAIEEVVKEPLEEQAEEEIVEMVQEESKKESAIEEVVEEHLEEQAEEEIVEMAQEESKEESARELLHDFANSLGEDEETKVQVVDTVSEVFEEERKQPVTEEQEKLIEKYKKRKHTKEIKEKVSGGFKVFLNVLWVIFGGLYNAISVIISGVIECITLIGIPFGIVLFKTVPLMFMPIGKRVVTHYGRHPIANTLWLIFGGFFFALGYTISAILLCLTIVGIPIALQMFKVSNILWAPFGAEILKMNEFSSKENEIVAYTIQYARKERIIVDLNQLNCDYRQEDIIRNICDISYPLNKVVKTEKNSLASTMSSIGMVLFVVLLFGVFQRFGISEWIHNAINQIGIPQEVLQYGPSVLIFSALILLVIFIIIYSISYKIFKTKNAYDYGYATRTELVNIYDNGVKINREVVSLVYVIYKLYQTEIDAEIEKDKNTKKEDE